MITRLEEARDADAICEITQQAFSAAERSSGTEGAIIDGLRAAGSLSLSLVAEGDGSVIGHVAFSPATVDGDEAGWFGLGPVSVAPGFQGGRHGQPADPGGAGAPAVRWSRRMRRSR